MRLLSAFVFLSSLVIAPEAFAQSQDILFVRQGEVFTWSAEEGEVSVPALPCPMDSVLPEQFRPYMCRALRETMLSLAFGNREIAVDKVASVSPDGKVAVAVFESDDWPRLYSFEPETPSVRRSLFDAGKVIAWSENSEWVLLQADSRACLVRASGGHSLCWNHFRAVAVNSASNEILLLRKGALYMVEVRGPNGTRPKKLITNVDAADWLANTELQKSN